MKRGVLERREGTLARSASMVIHFMLAPDVSGALADGVPEETTIMQSIEIDMRTFNR